MRLMVLSVNRAALHKLPPEAVRTSFERIAKEGRFRGGMITSLRQHFVWIHKFTDSGGASADGITRSEARFYRRLAENSLGLMCSHDLDGRLLWINPAAAQSLGY